MMKSTQNQFAALDLGSNSFHLLLVESEGSGFVVVERLKQKVQLLSGFKDGEIQAEAMDRGTACLARFAQRLRPVPIENVRVVGTCALRQATNQRAFTQRAEAILGCPVEVVSGAEEARLIYLGIAHQVPPANARLVIDIGGGSTEFAFGTGLEAEIKESINVGCVDLSDHHFTDAHVQSSDYRAAKQAALHRLSQGLANSEVLQVVKDDPELTTFGTSGTIESVAMVLQANGWADDGITRTGLAQLEQAIVADRWLIDGMPGLAPDRVDIFPAGVAVLSACFEILGLTHTQFVDVSLMQGIICEGLSQTVASDGREQSVAALCQRFAVDVEQAQRVAQCADQLYVQAAQWWDGDVDDEYRRLLGWAARLHELGMRIDARHYHRHGAYIVKHADLPGFSRLQHSELALLVRGHRRSYPGLAFQAFSAELADKLTKLVALLRISVILQRSHDDRDAPTVALAVDQGAMRLVFQADWLARHPLSQRELQVEVQQLATAGLHLEAVDASPVGTAQTP